jgi:hypothetical protein
MSLVVYYESTKDATYTDITAYYRTNSLEVTMGAEEGNTEKSSIEFDDPEGVLSFVGWRRIIVFETAGATGFEHIGSFWVEDKDISRRGTDSAFQTGVSRVWKVNLSDDNATLDFRLMTANAKRGAESDVAFVQWLMTHPSMARIPDTTFLHTDDPVQMDANRDYLGQKAKEALDDAAQDSGKNYYAYTVDAGPTPDDLTTGLWYGAFGLEEYDSDIQISNDPANIDDTDCFAMSDDTNLNLSPMRIFSGGYGQYDGGAAYAERMATSNEFTRRDTPIPMPNVKTKAQALRRINRELADFSTEEEVITTTIVVPPSAVNRLRHGMRVQFEATHLPGYQDGFVWLRCLKRTVRQRNFRYEVEVTLSKPMQGSTTALCTGLTAGGEAYPLGSFESDGTVYYLRPGIEYPQVVDPDHEGIWHFPELGAGGSGTVDYAGDCGLNIVRVPVVGDGTLEVHTATYSASSRNLRATLMHADPGSPAGVVVDETQDGVTGDTFEFSITTHSGLACTHWVDVGDIGDICGGKWGYAGRTWTPA